MPSSTPRRPVSGHDRALAVVLALSLLAWAGAAAANAAVDLGAALHDATCPDHAGRVSARTD